MQNRGSRSIGGRFEAGHLGGDEEAGIAHGLFDEGKAEPGSGEAEEATGEGAQEGGALTIGPKAPAGKLAEQLAEAIQADGGNADEEPEVPGQGGEAPFGEGEEQAKGEHGGVNSDIALAVGDLIPDRLIPNKLTGDDQISLGKAGGLAVGHKIFHLGGGARVNRLLTKEEPGTESKLVADGAVGGVDGASEAREAGIHEDRGEKREADIQQDEGVDDGEVAPREPVGDLVGGGERAATLLAAGVAFVAGKLSGAIAGGAEGGLQLAAVKGSFEGVGANFEHGDALPIGSLKVGVLIHIDEGELVGYLVLQGAQICLGLVARSAVLTGEESDTDHWATPIWAR